MRNFRPFAAVLLFVVALATSTGSGCASLFVQPRLNDADKRFDVLSPTGPKRSQSATQTLKARDLPTGRIRVPELEQIRERIDENPSPDLIYAYVETAYFEARRQEARDPKLAEEIYISTALYSYHYLFNPALSDLRRGSLFNARLLDVAVLYNGSCERLLRLILKESDFANAAKRKKRKNGADFPFKPNETYVLEGKNESCSIFCRVVSGGWRPEELESFGLAADCVVDELNFDCRRSGLGVPLVARRRPDFDFERPEEEYYPGGLCFPATAFLRPNPRLPLGAIPPILSDDSDQAALDGEIGDEPTDATAILEFYDPLVSSYATVDGRAVPLEIDLTTPLAYYLSTKNQLAFSVGQKGLFDPEKLLETVPGATGSDSPERTLQGLYMLQPYDPKKIPVVMIHGLGSSPMTWMEMFNSLRSVPEICDSYQFWFYFYPTGQPFWISAAQLRDDLETLRTTLDPERKEPTLDRTVLVGHSMGGLIARMQVATSGDRIWRKIGSVPFDEVDFDDETREKLRAWFFFEPNPAVRRVITISTPFEGSEFANGFTEWLADRAIAMPKTVLSVLATLTTIRSDQIDDPTLLKTTTSVQSLSPESPIFSALDECPIAENVALNNIVGVLPSLEKRWIAPKKSDGIVDFSSSHRDDVESEREVPSTHGYVHTHPAAILETKEILLRHLDVARAEMGGAAPEKVDETPSNVDFAPFDFDSRFDFDLAKAGRKKSRDVGARVDVADGVFLSDAAEDGAKDDNVGAPQNGTNASFLDADDIGVIIKEKENDAPAVESEFGSIYSR